MSTKNVRDEHLEDQAIEIAARFPEIHDPHDCLETVRLIRGLFDTILEREGLTDGLGAPALDESVYSVADAEKLSKKLRSLAHWRGITPVLTTRQLLERLTPEITALLEQGYSAPEVADTLTDLGVDVIAAPGGRR
jgi:hypothetical protein